MQVTTIFVTVLWLCYIFGCYTLTEAEAKNEKQNPPMNGTERWMWHALESYPDWIAEKKLDPSPIVEDPQILKVETSKVQLYCEIRNYFVDGFSQNIKIGNVSAEFKEGDNFLGFNYDSLAPSIVFEGDYNANGVLDGANLVAASGKWKLGFAKVGQSVDFEDVRVTPDGYLDISYDSTYGDAHYEIFPNQPTEFQFEGLFTNFTEEYKELVKIEFTKQFMSAIKLYYPAKVGFYQYIEDLFKKTPLADIQAGKIPSTSGGHIISHVSALVSAFALVTVAANLLH